MRHLLAARWRYVRWWLSRTEPVRLLLLGYCSYILLGWLLLGLPIFHKGEGPGALNHLFMATSAVSTTGLTTVSPADTYNVAGQGVLLLLIQFGGLGYMTISSFTLLALAGGLSPVRQRVATTALSLPEGFEVRSFLRTIVFFTLLIEVAGTALLYPVFVRHGVADPMWQAVFHSVSAFCTAGFSLFNDSLEGFRDDARLNTVIAVLSGLGAIGFIVLHDVWRSVRQLRPRLTLTSKVILAGTFWILLTGTVLFAWTEPTVASLPASQRWTVSFFQVMTASTTVGFNTVPIGHLSAASLFLLTVVMVIGASPSGTGGGLKTTTLSALWAMMLGVARRRERTTFLGREIPEVRLRAAVATLMFYGLTLVVGIYALALTEKIPLPDLIFECASALGTVGLSRGVTGDLSALGKLMVVALMFLGRLGPVALGLAFFERAAAGEPPPDREDMVV